MKTTVSRKAKQLGNALLVAMCISAFLCISIMGYLSVAEQQSFLSARSQAWNMAIAVTEAGLEEGIQQLNSNLNLTSDGWAYDGSSYWRSNNMGAGNSYTVHIYMTNALNPVIIARAYTTPPTLAQNSSTIFFAAGGVSVGSPAVTRAVQATCGRPNYFTAPMVARNDIDLKGNGVYTDSYDSQNPAKSLAGKYSLAIYSGNKGDIATDGGVTNSVGVGNANVYGKIHTGPNAAVSIGSGGGVGPHGSQTSDISLAVANGWVLQDANFTFPDTTFPDTSSYLPLPAGGTVITSSLAYNTNGVSNSSTYPSPPPPWGSVLTNNNPATVSTYPNPVPPGLTTNTLPVTSSTLPSPVVAGTVTNNTTTSTTTSGRPSPGTYVGSITTNYNGGGSIKNYTYNLITGHTYTYNTFTYTYPVYTYSYSTFSTNTVYTTNTYDTILNGNSSYSASSLSGKKVLINGPNVVLALSNGMDGTEGLVWAAGANLIVYSGGTSITVSGNGYINPNGAASSLIILAAPTVTSVTLNGNGQFTGVLVAPNADLVLNGGGSSQEDFCGSVMVNSVRLNGHFSFHYDESLASSANVGRYLVTTWNEIP